MSPMPMFAHILLLLHFISLSARVEASMDAAQPGPSHAALARSIAWVAIEVAPDAAERVASLLEATVAGESSFGLKRVGDGSRSHGAFQIWGRPDLDGDDVNGAREAYRQLLVGYGECPKAPVTMYLSGKCLLEGRVRRMADARMAMAKRFEEELTP